MTLRSFAFVLGLSLVPAFVIVESVDLPAAHAYKIELVEAQIGRIERATLKLSQLAKQGAPAGSSKVETEQWYRHTEMINGFIGELNTWHEKLMESVTRAKNGQVSSDDDKILMHFDNARKEMLLKLKTLSPGFQALKVRHEGTQQALGAISG